MKDTLERNGFWKQFELHVQFQLIVTVTYSYHFRFRIQAILLKINGKFGPLRSLQINQVGVCCSVLFSPRFLLALLAPKQHQPHPDKPVANGIPF